MANIAQNIYDETRRLMWTVGGLRDTLQDARQESKQRSDEDLEILVARAIGYLARIGDATKEVNDIAGKILAHKSGPALSEKSGGAGAEPGPGGGL